MMLNGTGNKLPTKNNLDAWNNILKIDLPVSYFPFSDHVKPK